MSELEQGLPIEELDRLFPPAIPNELMELVHERQCAYDESIPAHDDVVDDIRELDALWPIMNETVTISGYVYTPVAEDPDQPSRMTIKRVFVDEEVAMSQGFNATHMDASKNIHDELENNNRLVIGLQFVFPSEIVDQGFFHETTVKRKAFALPTEVEITRQYESPLSLFDKIHHFFPELANEIDAAILNTASASEAVLSLADLEVRLDPHVAEGGFGLISDYINSIITFDEKVPYHMDFSGTCYVIYAHDPYTPHEAQAFRGAVIVRPLRIENLRTNIIDADGNKVADEVSFGIRIQLLNPDPDSDDATEYVIPITETTVMRDIRSIVYRGLEIAERSA